MRCLPVCIGLTGMKTRTVDAVAVADVAAANKCDGLRAVIVIWTRNLQFMWMRTCDYDSDSIDVIHPCELWMVHSCGNIFVFFSYGFCLLHHFTRIILLPLTFPKHSTLQIKKKRRDWVYVSIGWRFASAIQVEVKQISQTRTYSVRRIKCVFVGN